MVSYCCPIIKFRCSPSGCGKTTLLDIIAGRKSTGSITGSLAFDGHKPTTAWRRRNIGYVEQRDTLVANMTVREMLLYTCEMKISGGTLASKAARVDAVLHQLALWDCRNVMIGSATAKGISGGQLKRANVALALVTHPKLLLLDEPTTGLDSFAATEMMRTLEGLRRGGLTVALTLHSPTPKAFEFMDRLYIMLGGRHRLLWSEWYVTGVFAPNT